MIKAFENKDQQADRIEEYWNIYNAVPDDNLAYAGNTPGYIPVVRDCVNARAKRIVKQLFPQRYKHVECVSSDGVAPNTQMALLEHYIRKTTMKSVVRADESSTLLLKLTVKVET